MQCCVDAARLVAGPRPLRALACAHDDSGDGSGGCAVSGSGDAPDSSGGGGGYRVLRSIAFGRIMDGS